MKILMLNWRCIKNKKGGGAEIFTHHVLKQLVSHGHIIDQFCARKHANAQEETIDGINYIRKGSDKTVHFHGYHHYKRHQDSYDLVIDQINTIPFFTPWYVKKPRIMFIHQLAREVWKYQAPLGLAQIGNLLEPHYLKAYRNEKIFTVSNSTKQDLLQLGCKEENIIILPEGIENTPTDNILSFQDKKPFSILYFGAVRPMKRVEEPIKALAHIVKKHPQAHLTIAGGLGDTKYKAKLDTLIDSLGIKNNITFTGRVTDEEKFILMKESQVLTVTSIREGWGLIVTEANSMGTPAVVYDVHGLRDSTKHYETGIVCEKNTPENLANNISRLFETPELYSRLQKNAWNWSKDFCWQKTYEAFIEGIQQFYPELQVK